MNNFFGKYRGTVTDTKDLNKQGRIEVSVPSVLGDKRLWAEPCVPYAGKDIGLFAIPPKGSGVWVEFEAGNRERPIWTGCFWLPGELPQKAAEATTAGEPEKLQMFKTFGVTLSVRSLSKGKKYLLLEVEKPVVGNPLKVLFNEKGIEINNNNKTIAKLTEKAIELKTGKDSIAELTQSALNLKKGSASVELSGNKVNINKGSHQIT